MNSIYLYEDYRKYVSDYFENSKPGTKTKAAKALDVHTSLLPQVLSGSCELSMEQADKFNKFLGHNEDEAFFFLLLVMLARSGSSGLRQSLKLQIEQKRRQQSEISNRVAKEKTISDSDQEKFYSSYVYAAIHVLSSIPNYNSVSKIAESLGRPENEIKRAVDFLNDIGVVKIQGSNLAPGSSHVHLPSQSLQIVNHHLNWRFKAIEKIRENPKTTLHYSGAFSLSEDDVLKVKEVVLSAIANSTKIATKSPEETAYVLCADFFPMSK